MLTCVLTCVLTSIIERFTARRVPDGLLLFRDRATGGHGHARLQKFGQRVPDFAKLPGFLLSGGRANGHGQCPVHPYMGATASMEMARLHTVFHSTESKVYKVFRLLIIICFLM